MPTSERLNPEPEFAGPSTFTIKDQDAIIRLYRQGASYQAIARAIGKTLQDTAERIMLLPISDHKIHDQARRRAGA